MLSNLAFIPARSGSKQVKDKNVRLFCGKPLFMWSVLSAIESSVIDTIVVSSNCSKVKHIFDSFKFNYTGNKEIIWIERPSDLCLDSSITESAIDHAICSLPRKYDYIFILQPTSPVRKKGMLDDAFELMIKNDRYSLMSVSKHTPFFVKLNDNNIKWYYDPQKRKMRQDLSDDEFFYHDDGCLYIIKNDVFQKNKCRIDYVPYLYVNDELSSMQIDSDLDFRIMEKIQLEIQK